MIKKRRWEAEDITHLDDFIKLELSTGTIALPGLESIRDQIALRLHKDTKYKDHDKPRLPSSITERSRTEQRGKASRRSWASCASNNSTIEPRKPDFDASYGQLPGAVNLPHTGTDDG